LEQEANSQQSLDLGAGIDVGSQRNAARKSSTSWQGAYMNNDYREARFPIRLPLEPDESGQGYLLRLGALNGFEKARQALTGKGWGSMPT
jgi:hypothetical protein